LFQLCEINLAGIAAVDPFTPRILQLMKILNLSASEGTEVPLPSFFFSRV
jgi:hypothetical protein